MVEVSQSAVRYTDVRCSSCKEPLEPADDSVVDEHGWKHLHTNQGLHIQLSGSYNEFVDLGSESDYEDTQLVLCPACARTLADAFPYIKDTLFRHLNLNVGHTCTDGTQTWVPEPKCTLDPDRHGWRTVWVVTPLVQPRRPNLVAFLVADTEAQAEAFTAAHPGLEVDIHTTPVANTSVYTLTEA